jgi:hypothetical protein
MLSTDFGAIAIRDGAPDASADSADVDSMSLTGYWTRFGNLVRLIVCFFDQVSESCANFFKSSC